MPICGVRTKLQADRGGCRSSFGSGRTRRGAPAARQRPSSSDSVPAKKQSIQFSLLNRELSTTRLCDWDWSHWSRYAGSWCERTGADFAFYLKSSSFQNTGTRMYCVKRTAVDVLCTRIWRRFWGNIRLYVSPYRSQKLFSPYTQ